MSKLWEEMRKQLDMEFTVAPDNFLRQPVATRALHPDQLVNGMKYINEVITEDHLIPDPSVMNPRLCDGSHSLITLQSAYYIRMMKDNFDFNNINEIHDIGGGYGNMAWMLRSMGYNKDYNIYDFPELHRIQEHFLKSNNIKVTMKDLSELNPGKNSLMIATHSINEMSLDERKVIDYDKFSYIFINHNSNFEKVDNHKYFKSINKSLTNHTIHQFQSPMQMSHFFFIGSKNA